MLCSLLLVACGQESAELATDKNAQPVDAGEQIYNQWCVSCHYAGLSGAPRLTVPEDWAMRLPKGRKAMLAAVIDGLPPTMPARGFCRTCSDAELALTLDYMLRGLPEYKAAGR